MTAPTSRAYNTGVDAQSRVDGVEPYLDLLPLQGKTPWRLRRLLPDPCRSLEQLERYQHGDIAQLTREQRGRERLRIAMALAEVDDESRMPTWLHARIARLSEPPPSSRERNSPRRPPPEPLPIEVTT